MARKRKMTKTEAERNVCPGPDRAVFKTVLTYPDAAESRGEWNVEA